MTHNGRRGVDAAQLPYFFEKEDLVKWLTIPPEEVNAGEGDELAEWATEKASGGEAVLSGFFEEKEYEDVVSSIYLCAESGEVADDDKQQSL